MSKKSRRRNRRLLGALAALGGAAMLANRKRNQANVELDLPKSNTFSKPNMLDVAGKKIVDVPTPKNINPIPRLKVNYKGEVIKKGKNTGVGNMDTKFINRSPDKGPVGIYQGGEKVSDLNPNAINVLSDGSIMAKGVTYPNRSAYANRNKMPSNLSRDMGMKRTPVIDDSFFSDAMAKDGGKIVKTETGGKAVKIKNKKGIQIRGFGKARRG